MEIKKTYPKRVFPTEEIVRISLHENQEEIGSATINHYTDKFSMLDHIHIKSQYQGKKYSNTLMQEVVKEIDAKENIGIVALVTDKHDSEKASYLYQKYGFEPCTPMDCQKDKDIYGNPVCYQSLIREGKQLKKDSKEYQHQLHSWLCKTK